MFDAASRDKFKLSHSNNICLDAHVIDECIDGALSSAKDVDLSSFRPQEELNPNIWINGKLNSRVRLRLLDISDDFIDTFKTDWVKPDDIILTGSLANYNWSKYSDFDVHVIMDFSKVDERTEFVKDYYDAKKSDWNNKHDNLKIYGFPVEMYVQDLNELHAATGVYSLEDNDWIVQPDSDNIQAIMLNKFFIKEKVLKYSRLIKDIYEASMKTDDEYELRQLAEKSKKLFDRIKGLRKEGLKNGNEMSTWNIFYKCLRRNGSIKCLIDLKSELYDKMRSIEK
jgi:hypothetical protein